MPSKVLVMGLGEVGRPLYDLAKESKNVIFGYDIDSKKSANSSKELPTNVDILHIAFPCQEQDTFVKRVLEYTKKYQPSLVLIHSTVPPLTTKRVQDKTKTFVAYSAVRGKHPYIGAHLRLWTKWVASYRKEALEDAKNHLTSLGFKVRIASSPASLEIAKLWETVYRAIMIASWQEVHRVCRKFDADILDVSEFIAEVHEVLKDRPVFYPDYIGGHCLIPNTKLLGSTFESKLLDFVLRSNDLRSEEMKDESVREEIMRVTQAWRKQAPVWYLEGGNKPR